MVNSGVVWYCPTGITVSNMNSNTCGLRIHIIVEFRVQHTGSLPKSLISVWACPVCPSASVTVQVCTPASLDFRMPMVIALEELSETEQLEQVEDQW